ncbi:MAG: response regulator [Sulfuricurvum sp.]|nr:response regulator [Sulfuricurvum sp.]
MAKILVVDDASLIRMVAQKAILEAGHEAILAENGAQGVQMFQNTPVDFIFSDINMPVMGGFDMIREIKKLPGGSYIPIVMLTTESNDELKLVGRELGVKAWLLKPFNKEKFLLVIQKLCR